MESLLNVPKAKQVYKNKSFASSQVDAPLPISPIIPMFELFKSKYPSISNDYSFHIPLDENTNNPVEKLCDKRKDDSCNMLQEKSMCTTPKEIDLTRFKRKNDESVSNYSKKKKYNNNKDNQTKKSSDVNFAKPKVNLPLIVKDPTYRRLIDTRKYFTKDQHLRPQYSKIIRSGSKLQLPLKELRDLFYIFSQYKELDEFYTFAQYFLK